MAFPSDAGPLPHESTAIVALLIGADEQVTDGDGGPVALSGDKGYREDGIDEYLIGLGIVPLIPSMENEDRSARPLVFDPDDGGTGTG